MSSKGKLYLIPNTLGATAIPGTLPASVIDAIRETDVYIVENGKEARRLIKHLDTGKELPSLEFFELNKHTSPEDIGNFMAPLLSGRNTGIISDAGCPGVADPGSEIVRLAHQNRVKVIPLTGPSSILLGLMASGFNGQHFIFHGYLPRDRNERISELKKLEKTSEKLNQTQIFIETPYRNDQMIENILAHCHPQSRLCVAANLTLPDEIIISSSVADWKKIKKSFHKMPAVFLLYAGRQ